VALFSPVRFFDLIYEKRKLFIGLFIFISDIHIIYSLWNIYPESVLASSTRNNLDIFTRGIYGRF